MAITKNIEMDSGVVVSYWKILSLGQDYVQNKTNVTVGGYINEEARKEGKTTTDIKYLQFDLLSGEGDLRVEAYEAVKSTEDFIDAIDN